MKILLSVICLLLLTSCGPSQEEKQKIAAVTCSIMGETKNMDGAVRVEKINEAREKIGAEPFLGGDYVIKEAFEWGLCQALVLNDENYDERLQELKDALAERERIAAEKLAEEERIAAEKRAEEVRTAGSRPSIKETFYSSGQLEFRHTYQSENDGGKLHGLMNAWHENGQLWMEGTFKNGGVDGLSRMWRENGQLEAERTYKNGKRHGIERYWHENGKLKSEICNSNDEEVDMSNCP